MVLKESFRYQNYLDKLIDSAIGYLTSRDFITTTTQEHMREKANADAKDETITVAKQSDVNFTPMKLVDFVVKVLDEKDKLSSAIVNAKKNTEIDIDSSITMNKKRQEFVGILNHMNGVKPSQKDTFGSDYKFNADGDQVSYRYPMREVVTIDYDRNDIKALIKKYNKQCDDISTKLDTIQLTTEIDFEPKWDIGDALEDAVLV